MGPSTASLSDALFSSVQRRVLGLLFGQPDKAFHGNDIIKRAASGRGAVRRELDRLVSSGLVTMKPQGNQKLFQANPHAPIYAELCGIVNKTFGVADPLRAALQPVAARVTLAFIYGSVAKQSDRSESDIDLLVVSDSVGYQELLATLEETEGKVGRRISPTVLTVAEFARRRAEPDGFLARVLAQPVIALIGDPHAAAKPGKPGPAGKPQKRAAGRRRA